MTTHFDAARAWLAQDPDEHTRAELSELLRRAESGDAAADADLRDRFSGRLSFGTAGLRAELGAGPRRMNRAVVIQTTAGFAEFLLQRAARGETSTPPRVVIGFDARHNSDVFARDVAAVCAGAGVTPILLPGPVPTPLTAFAVRFFEASAGVMITASHNPPRDNGYKVYLGDADTGCQIIPPSDDEIAACISEAARRPLADIPLGSGVDPVGTDVIDAYLERTAAAVRDTVATVDGAAETQPEMRVVYTAMHGVGWPLTRRLFALAGLPEPHPVAEQIEPDGDFPTVAFPNPEEPGALDLSFATAAAVHADLIIAQDPDADRLAVALPTRESTPEQPSYAALTGNQLGLLLGWRMAEKAARKAAGATPALACTIVSSPALSAVAERYGFDYAETLSGFKWVSRTPNLVFGFEEALGYLVHPETVHDKDGISASAELVAYARELRRQGKTLWDALDDAAAEFGAFASAQVTVRLESAAAVEELATRLRSRSLTELAGIPVSHTTDLLTPGAAAVPANVLRYDLRDGSRLMVRPSGTEPKLKLYIDTRVQEGDVAQRQREAQARLTALTEATRAMLADLERA